MPKKRRFVLAGCGGISHSWLAAIQDHFADRLEPAGFVDLREENARAVAGKFYPGSDLPTGTSLEAMLAEIRPDIVFNCTIPEAHASTCGAALRAGCDVLVEKPLASNLAEARELAALAARTGKRLAVIQNRRYHPGAVATKNALAGGAIGRIHTIHADFFLGPRFGGFRATMEHPLLLDMAIHTFDEARFLSGFDPVRVSCHEFNPPGSWFSQGASAVALFEMTNETLFTYRGSWCAQGHPTNWNASWRIIGESGTLLWDGDQIVTVERVLGSWDGTAFSQPVERLEIPLELLTEAQLGHAGNIGEFLDALDAASVPQTCAEDNLQSLVMVAGAVQSAENEGCPVLVQSFFYE